MRFRTGQCGASFGMTDFGRSEVRIWLDAGHERADGGGPLRGDARRGGIRRLGPQRNRREHQDGEQPTTGADHQRSVRGVKEASIRSNSGSMAACSLSKVLANEGGAGVAARRPASSETGSAEVRADSMTMV